MIFGPQKLLYRLVNNKQASIIDYNFTSWAKGRRWDRDRQIFIPPNLLWNHLKWSDVIFQALLLSHSWKCLIQKQLKLLQPLWEEGSSIFTSTHIRTAVSTSLVCPLSEITVLSEGAASHCLFTVVWILSLKPAFYSILFFLWTLWNCFTCR